LRCFRVSRGAGGSAFPVDNGHGVNTIGYSGLTVGQTINIYISDSVTDGIGASFSSRYPTATTMSVTRTS